MKKNCRSMSLFLGCILAVVIFIIDCVMKCLKSLVIAISMHLFRPHLCSWVSPIYRDCTLTRPLVLGSRWDLKLYNWCGGSTSVEYPENWCWILCFCMPEFLLNFQTPFPHTYIFSWATPDTLIVVFVFCDGVLFYNLFPDKHLICTWATFLLALIILSNKWFFVFSNINFSVLILILDFVLT